MAETLGSLRNTSAPKEWAHVFNTFGETFDHVNATYNDRLKKFGKDDPRTQEIDYWYKLLNKQEQDSLKAYSAKVYAPQAKKAENDLLKLQYILQPATAAANRPTVLSQKFFGPQTANPFESPLGYLRKPSGGKTLLGQ